MVRLNKFFRVLTQEVKMVSTTIGKWAFMIGLALAVLAGILFQAGWVFWVLALLGVIVGLLNIHAENSQSFLLAAVALTLSAAALNSLPVVGSFLKNIMGYVAALVAGAMVVVALKALFRTAR
jgi:hypothetical protein